MTPWIDTANCVLRVSCQNCRGTGDSGVRWREQIGKDYSLPVVIDEETAGRIHDARAFVCPRGVPWDCGPQPLTVSLPPLPRRRAMPRPGFLLSRMIHDATGIDSAGCSGCDARVKQMNIWGYAGCVLRWRTIRGWLEAECRKLGIEPNAKRTRNAIVGGLRYFTESVVTKN